MFIKIKNIKFNIKYILIFIIFILSNRFHFNLVCPGLDNSWVYGVNKLFLKNYQFGIDSVFTFGPLGFLFMPLFVEQGLWIFTICINLAVNFIFVFLFYRFIDKNFKNYYLFYSAILLFIFINNFYFIQIDYKIVFSSIFIIFNIFSSKNMQNYILLCNLILFSFISSFVLLIKGNTFILVLYFSIILYIILVKQYKIRFIIFSAVSIILFFLVLWVSSGQKITNIFNYFFSIGEISKGYNSSMGVNISKRTNFIYTYLVLVFSIFSFIILTIYAYFNKNKNLIFLLLTNIFIFFVIYKHSYIRHDAGHLFFYYQYISLFNLIVLYLILIKEKFNKMTFAVILYPVFFLIFLFGNANSLKSKYEKNIFTLFYNNQINNVQAIKPFFQKKNETNKIIEIHKEKLQNFYNIDKNFINKIGIETVDVMPVEINLSYAYNLNWTPRPVLQSYSAYSVKLDNRDADFFNRNNSPLYLIYTYEAIDNRYPLFEEPAAMFTILKNYKYEDRSKKFLLLKKRTDKREITEEFIGSINLKSGEFFNIPESDDEIFAAIKIKNSFFENVISIFFKPGITYIEFINSKNETFSYRILPDVLENKVLISEIILNNDDMISLFKGESDNRTYKIRIIKYPVFYPFYKNYPPIIKGLINMEYSVDFYKVK